MAASRRRPRGGAQKRGRNSGSDGPTSAGSTPEPVRHRVATLHAAVAAQDVAGVQRLLALGADANGAARSGPFAGMTPMRVLVLASAHGHYPAAAEVARMLLHAGARDDMHALYAAAPAPWLYRALAVSGGERRSASRRRAPRRRQEAR
jgi:hypothetical protein